MTTAPAPRSSAPWLFAGLGGLGVLVIAFLVVWQLLAPAEKTVFVPYTQYVADVRAGDVDEVHITGKEVRFHLRGKNPYIGKATTCESTAQAMKDALQPNEKNLPAPKVVLEK